jgi:hypothetical protein
LFRQQEILEKQKEKKLKEWLDEKRKIDLDNRLEQLKSTLDIYVPE